MSSRRRASSGRLGTSARSTSPPFTMSVNVSPRQLRHPDFVERRAQDPHQDRVATVTSDARDHRELHGRRPRERASATPRAQGARCSHLDGRLRHRATHRWHRSRTCPWTSSRSTSSLSTTSPRIRVAPLSPRRSSGWARPSASGSSPRVSRPPSRAERLQSLGCRFAQGFYFSRPVPAERSSGCSTPRTRCASPEGDGPRLSHPTGAPGCACWRQRLGLSALRRLDHPSRRLTLRRWRRCGRGCRA